MHYSQGGDGLGNTFNVASATDNATGHAYANLTNNVDNANEPHVEGWESVWQIQLLSHTKLAHTALQVADVTTLQTLLLVMLYHVLANAYTEMICGELA